MATKLKDRASIEKIIGEMTLEEKAACVTGGTPFYTRAMEKYGIPRLLWLDGGTGFNTNQFFLDKIYQDYAQEREKEGKPVDDEEFPGRMGGLELVLNNQELWNRRKEYAQKEMEGDREYGCYPPGMLLGATWNPLAAEECGQALGREANARGIDVLLGSPNVNIHRDPRNGRLFEGYSEDPCLVSKMAPSFVRGIQAEGVIADVKHFAANNQETDRMGVNEHISQRALREIYFPGFQACVEAGCRTVMSAYNLINGVPCAENPWLLKDVLRGEWGFEGCVVSDWSAACDQVEACRAGNDLVMPGPRSYSTVVKAVEEGELALEDLDQCVRNFLRIAVDTPAMKGRREGYEKEEGIRAAYRAAAEGITLLKNDGVLPLKPDASLAFYGERSREMIASGAGSAAVNTSLDTNVYDCALEALGPDRVTFREIREDTQAVIITVGVNGQEGADRPDMKLDPEDCRELRLALDEAKKKKIPAVVLLNAAGPVEVEEWEEDASAILCLFIPGMQGGAAAMDILLGKVNPSGKLPLTFPRRYQDCPTYGNFPGYAGEVWYGEGIYVGYRYYEKKGVEVSYPFGHGLSYTEFSITGLQAPQTVNVDEEDARLSLRVKNTGGQRGAQVVQLYVQDVESVLDKPVKELKAFQKVWLDPGEERELSFVLKKKDFASYDDRFGQWVTEPGVYRFLAGGSSAQIEQTAKTRVLCANPYQIGPRTEIEKVVADAKASGVVEELTGINLRQVAGSYIVFQPLTAFEMVWRECVLPAIKVSPEKGEALEQEIYRRWKE